MQHVAGGPRTTAAHALPDFATAVQDQHLDIAPLGEELLHVDLRSDPQTVALLIVTHCCQMDMQLARCSLGVSPCLQRYYLL